jgi:hypothetical protein
MVPALRPVSVQARAALQVETVLLGKYFVCYLSSFIRSEIETK